MSDRLSTYQRNTLKPSKAYRATLLLTNTRRVMENLAQRTDDELVALFVSGRDEAFDTLLARYQDRLYSYISRTIRNKDLADDLFQETFVKAIVVLRQGRYTSNGKFFGWLTRIAHNLLIDVFRDERGGQLVYEEEAELSLFDNLTLVSRSRESDIVNEQVLHDVRRLMDFLPETQREVVFMRFYQELSFKEIADITGVSINTALGRMRYAVLNMRRMAHEHGISLQVE